MKFAELKKHIQASRLNSGYVITGEDAFLVQTSVAHFKSLITVLPELNISFFYEGSDARTVVEAAETLPIGSNYRLVFCFDFKGDTAPFLDYLQHPNLQSVLVLVSQKLPESFSKIMAQLEVVDCAPLESAQLAKWIVNKLQETNATISAEAATLLIHYCDRSMTRIHIEAQKLGLARTQEAVSIEDVKNLVTPSESYRIYELSEAVAAKNAPRIANILKSLFAAKSPPITLLGMLYGHFRRLLYCAIDPQNPNLAKLLGVKDYAIKMSVNQARTFSTLKLKKICDQFHAMDFAIKSGEIGEKLGLELQVLRILNI